MRSAVLWLVLLLALLVQAQPPPSLASLQAQLEALKAQLPPTCNGSSFLQRNATGWTCVTPVRQSGNSSGWCRASQDGSETITCDASPSLLGSPPDCRPPGAKWLGYNSTRGGWICVCNVGWTGTSCNVSTAEQQNACSAPPVCVAPGWIGFYQYVNGTMVCQCLQGWGGVDCGQEESSTSLGVPPPSPPSPPPPPPPSWSSGVQNIALGPTQYSVWMDIFGGKSWLLVMASPAADSTWCYGSAKWQSATAVNQASLLSNGGLNVTAGSMHNLFFSYDGFNEVRIRTISSVGNSYVGTVAGTSDLLFAFNGTNSVRNLMFTSVNFLVSGPTYASWRASFGQDRTGEPFFERNGSCSNITSALGTCRPRKGCGQPLMFGFQAYDWWPNDVNSGLGTNSADCGGTSVSCSNACRGCGFAIGDWMNFPGAPDTVLVYAALPAPPPPGPPPLPPLPPPSPPPLPPQNQLPSSPLAPECTSYIVLNGQSYRRFPGGSDISKSDATLATAWYRFDDSGWNYLLTASVGVPSTYQCGGTAVGGYLTAPPPVAGTACIPTCFAGNFGSCESTGALSPYSCNPAVGTATHCVNVTSCGSYYVYYLSAVLGCTGDNNLGFCTSSSSGVVYPPPPSPPPPRSPPLPSPPSPMPPLPPLAVGSATVCTSQYILIDDPGRDYQASGGCRDDSGLAQGWYRFKENGLDAKIPEYPAVPEAWQTGGTERSSRLLNLNPSISDGIVSATITFPWGNGVRVGIQIVNCGSFYLYFLSPFSSPTYGGLGGCNGVPCGYVVQLV
jgi:hypothetical protein